MNILPYQTEIAERMLVGTEGETIHPGAQFVQTANGYWIAARGRCSPAGSRYATRYSVFWVEGAQSLEELVRWSKTVSLTKWKSLTATMTRGTNMRRAVMAGMTVIADVRIHENEDENLASAFGLPGAERLRRQGGSRLAATTVMTAGKVVVKVRAQSLMPSFPTGTKER